MQVHCPTRASPACNVQRELGTGESLAMNDVSQNLFLIFLRVLCFSIPLHSDFSIYFL